MASLKKVLRSKPNKEGLYPVTIRITAQRSSAFIYTNEYIPQENWEKDGEGKIKGTGKHIAARNHRINKMYLAIESFILKNDLYDRGLTGGEIKELYLKGNQKKRGAKFFEFAETVAEEYKKDQKFNEYGTFNSQMKFFKKFAGESLTFEKITPKLLRKFQRWLKLVREVSPRTITDYLITIRLVYNRAIRAELVERKHYPFGKEGVRVQVTPTLKIGLNREELTLLEACSLDNTIPSRWHARNIWLFSFYLAGSRFTDVITLKKSDIIDGRIPFVMSKNQKPINLKLPQKAKTIADHYLKEHNQGKYLFPDMDRTVMNSKFEERRRIRSINRNINRQLENLANQLGISKRVSMHIARHTFGNLAGGNVPPQILQKLFNHESLETTLGYQAHFIHDSLDGALEQVVGQKG